MSSRRSSKVRPQAFSSPSRPSSEGITGRYFADCQEAPVVEPGTAGSRGFGVAAYALDPDIAERLWGLSLMLLGDGNDASRQIP